MNRYVLTNYTIQCTDEISGKCGCFLFDLNHYEYTGKFKATGEVYNDLESLYKNTNPNDRKPCYVEFKGGLK